MTYVIPQVLVHQELETLPAANENPLYACIVGPHYYLTRYAEAAEKALGDIGAYAEGSEFCNLWPNRPAGGVVDQSWTKLFADDAYLKYWSNPSTITVAASGDSNRISSASVNFKTYSTYTRDTSLKSRDVQIGDGVRVVGTGTGGDSYDILTKVTGFEHVSVAAVTGSATSDADNKASTTAAVSSSQTAGDENTVVIDSESGAAFDGLEAGVLSDTYTVEVIQGGTETAARLKVTSLSGTDNQASITPATFGSATSIGTRGLTATFDTTGSGTDLPAAEFIDGQIWEVVVTQDYTVPTPVEGGTYTGPVDASYIITVTKGGDLNEAVVADQPQISVTTTTGADFGGPYAIDNSSAVTIGNYGVTIAFADDSLVTGDRFIIPVTAAKDGAVRTLVLANAMPTDLAGEDVSVDLYIIKDVEIPEYASTGIGVTNFSQTDTQICASAAIQLTDSTWYETSTGEEVLMDLYQADMYVQYRALIQDYTSHTHVFTLGDLPAQISPENPFVYGLYKALSNSGGTPVRGISVKTDNLAGYQTAVNDLTLRDDVYGIVPLSQDRAIQDLIAAHVTSMSSPENALWRVAWLNSSASEEEVVYNEDADGEMLVVTVIDDDGTTGTQYTKVVIEDGGLLTNSVQSGDILRVNYTTDSSGTDLYEEYVIDRVVSEGVAILLTGPDAAVNTASRAEVWRNLTTDAIADAYATTSGSFGDRRIRHIWPDVISAAGEDVYGYYLCAALSGLRSGSAPHQGLTNVEIAGFDLVARSTEFFTKSQLDVMAEAGTWIVTQDFETGNIFSRHQLTTGNYSDQNEREDSITANLDSISYSGKAAYAPYIGKVNVTPEFIGLLEVITNKFLTVHMSSANSTLGPQLIGYDIIELRQHELLRDRIVASINLDLPFPFNNMDLFLVI